MKTAAVFGFFGLGTQEFLLLCVLGVVAAGLVAVVLLMVMRSSSSSTRMRALEEENRRLREDLDRPQDRPV
jgi:hypothetical protein